MNSRAPHPPDTCPAGQWKDCSHYWTSTENQCLLCGHHAEPSTKEVPLDVGK